MDMLVFIVLALLSGGAGAILDIGWQSTLSQYVSHLQALVTSNLYMYMVDELYLASGYSSSSLRFDFRLGLEVRLGLG